jgi:O-antigen ligase
MKNPVETFVTRSRFFLLCLIYGSLPVFAPHWHGILLFCFGSIWLLSTPRSELLLRPNGEEHEIRYFLFNILGWVGLSAIGLVFSNNLIKSLHGLESMIPFFVLPWILFQTGEMKDPRKGTTFLLFFAAGVILLNLASLAFISYDLWDPVNLQSNIILANNALVKIHPVFLSLYISFCIFLIVDQFFPLNTADRKRVGWILFGLIILITYLLWINSRAGIISFFLASIPYIFLKYKSKRRALAYATLLMIGILILVVPFSKKRFLDSPLAALRGTQVDMNDKNLAPLLARKQIFDCSLELLKKREIFFGYGTGDSREEMRLCYLSKGYTYPYQEDLDSHNEYFSQLHDHGIGGLMLFFLLLLIPLRYALKYKSPLLIAFIVLFASTALFENVLSAQKGVTFFALICPLLMLLAKRQNLAVENGKTPTVPI